jgi:hypothetical protein
MNHYAWPDGTPKSQGNAFNWAGNSTIAQANQRAADHGKAASTTVNRKRAAGIDMSTIPGLSDKKQAHDINPKRFQVYSKEKA